MSESQFVPLSGMHTEAGPLIGVMWDGPIGVPMVLDLQKGHARPVEDGESIIDPTMEAMKAQARERQAQAPTQYALANQSGQPGRYRTESLIEAALRHSVRSDSMLVVAIQGDDVRALTAQERAYIQAFLTSVNLVERISQ